MLSDLRYALRSLRRSPGFTLVAVLTLALGIGANTAVFSWMEGLVLNPFPAVRDPGQLVSVKVVSGTRASGSMSYPAFRALRAGARSVEGLTVYQFYQFGLQDGAAAGPAEPVWGAFATPDYFTTLGVRPLVGRGFLPDDSVAGAPPIAVLSYALWQHHFGGDRGVVGRRVRLNGREVTVVGVAPPNFAGSFAGFGFELWVPLAAYDQLGDYTGKLDTPYSWWLTAFARLRPGVTLEQARAELAAVGGQVARAYPDYGVTSAAVEPYDGGGARRILRPMFVALLGVTALVLLIVCANLASLLLARAAARRRELGVRAALGAGRGRLARQLLLESLALAVPGALLGVALAAWGRGALGALVPAGTGLPLATDTPLDLRVLAFVVALTLAATLLFGLVPALRASRPALVPALKSGTPGAGEARSRLRGAFVVAQVALSLVAVVSAGLFLRTLRSLEQLDPGFRDPEHVLLMTTDFGFAGTRDDAKMRATVDQLVERARAIPGVSSAAVADYVPMGLSGGDNWSLSVPGYVPRKDEQMSFGINHVTPDYFAAMGIPLLRGRTFTPAERSGDDMAVVISESFARRFFAGADPLGRRIALGLGTKPNATVVGVAKNGVGSFNELSELAGPPPPFFYIPYAASPVRGVTLHLRTQGDPLALVPAVRRAVAEVDPTLPVLSPQTLAEHASGAFFLQRVGATVLGALGGVALLLAALGLYGVVAYSVAQRTREIGIRMALGAAHRQVVAAFLRDGLRLATIGLALGALAALGAGRLLASQLYGVGAGDPVTLLSTAALLAAVALLASWIPARRATRVDPMTALRSE